MAKETVQKKVVLTAEQRAQVKRAAFVKVVTPRVGKALKAIRLIGNCASPNYLYTPEQVDAMIKALQLAVGSVVTAYAKKAQKTAEFSFPS